MSVHRFAMGNGSSGVVCRMVGRDIRYQVTELARSGACSSRARWTASFKDVANASRFGGHATLVMYPFGLPECMAVWSLLSSTEPIRLLAVLVLEHSLHALVVRAL